MAETEVKSAVTTVREFFSTPERPVEMSEIRALGVASIKELATLIEAQH